MKPAHTTVFANTSLRRGLLACPLLLLSVAVSLSATASEPDGALTLYQNNNNQSLPCSFAVPGTASDKVVKFLPKTAGLCPKDDDEDADDESFKPHSIRIRNAPAAARFLLTGDNSCEKTARAWIELETTRPVASLETIGLDKITTYSGYLTNRGVDSNANTLGFKIVGHQGRIDQGTLSCIKITTSGGPGPARN